MDPRMDSALVPPGVTPPEVPFTDPNAPLLAEEVCWVLDRTMSAEVSHRSPILAIFVLTRRVRWDGIAAMHYPRRCTLRFTCIKSHRYLRAGLCRSIFLRGGMILRGPLGWCLLCFRLGLWPL